MPNEVDWTSGIWDDLNQKVVEEVGRVRVCQKVFPTKSFTDNPTEVINDVVQIPAYEIQEGRTKPFVEIFQEFYLTTTQVRKEPEIRTARTLARMAAKTLALGEDALFFSGRNPQPRQRPQNLLLIADDAAADGLLGEASAEEVIPVELVRRKQRPDLLWGERLFQRVADGITRLVAKGQAPQYALFLPTRAFADIQTPPGEESLVTTYERIKPLVEGGLYGTGTLPADSGLLVALGGDPTYLYVGREANVEYLRKEGGRHIFRVFERVQFVVRDRRALVLLNLEQPQQQAQPANP